MPINEASSPITAASNSTDRRICLREAPIIRSRPNSRARWATVIESVLKMMNAPTNRAMPPNATRVS